MQDTTLFDRPARTWRSRAASRGARLAKLFNRPEMISLYSTRFRNLAGISLVQNPIHARRPEHCPVLPIVAGAGESGATRTALFPMSGRNHSRTATSSLVSVHKQARSRDYSRSAQ